MGRSQVVSTPKHEKAGVRQSQAMARIGLAPQSEARKDMNLQDVTVRRVDKPTRLSAA